MSIRLLLVDDHTLVRFSLRLLLEAEPDLTIIGEAGSVREAYAAVDESAPDVVLLDIGLPDGSGIGAAREIKRRCPATAIIALTIYEDEEYFFRMLEAGASGYVPKRAAPQELLTAVRAAARGEVYLYPSLARFLVKDFLEQEQQSRSSASLDGLTAREQEVLRLLAEGASNGEIGERLAISPKTVARHRENIMRKLNLHSRSDLVKYAIRKGVIQV